MAAINEANRGRIMAAIRARNTTPELLVRKLLRSRGWVGYRCHPAGLPGKPDVVFSRWKIAIFVDGAFWHGHPLYVREHASAYWRQKIRRNAERDRMNREDLRSLGWKTIRFWDFEVEADPLACLRKIEAALDAAAAQTIPPSNALPPTSRQ